MTSDGTGRPTAAPPVRPSALSLALAIPALLLSTVLILAANANNSPALGVTGLALGLAGILWLIQGVYRLASSLDRVAKALIERADRTR